MEMCESTVYLLKGSEKIKVMDEVARILASGDDLVCIDPLGGRRTIPAARISDANFASHEIIVKSL